MSPQTHPPEIALRLSNVRMRYLPRRRLWRLGSEKHANAPSGILRDVNLEVARGERLAIFGENGAGKTTLLKLIAGMLLPSEGSVVWNPGVDTRSSRARTSDARESQSRHVGYVMADERSFYWRLSAFENLRFFAALNHLFGADADSRIGELLRAVGLEADATRSVGEYSTGMKQRLALARGLLHAPDTLLLDEPTRGLDPTAVDAIHELLRGPAVAGRTLIVATNRFEDAATLCHRVVVLAGGALVADTANAQGFSVPQVAEFVRSTLGSLRAP